MKLFLESLLLAWFGNGEGEERGFGGEEEGGGRREQNEDFPSFSLFIPIEKKKGKWVFPSLFFNSSLNEKSKQESSFH